MGTSEINLKGCNDSTLADYAAKNFLMLITQNRDFGRLHRTFPKRTLTIIIIRAKPATPDNIIQLLDSAKPKIDQKKIEGKLVIITKNRIRITS